MNEKLVPFRTDQTTADALVAVAKQHVMQPTDGQVVGVDGAGVTTQFQNTCQFKLTTDWKQVKDSTQNFVASGEKILPLQVGAEKRSYPTTIYAYGEQPTTGKDSIIVATRRANRWVLLPTGTGVAAPGKARLVQPKELFPACEYKSPTEHYIVCPGGRDANKQTIPFIYSFDLVAEKWKATKFPVLTKPMFNMDAKIVKLADETYQLVILSGENNEGFSDFLQGYNFEKDNLKAAVNIAKHFVNFSGRPALVGDPMLRGFPYNTPAGENNFSQAILAVGGSEHSTIIDYPYGTVNSTANTSLFYVAAESLEFGKAYRRSWSSNSSVATIEKEVAEQKQYTRHQNFPVRGILRRRPKGDTSAPTSSKPVVDFLLIGGFNPRVGAKNDRAVVSGMFGNSSGTSHVGAAMFATGATFSGNNTSEFIKYPLCDKVLGDCCAEYLEERDEIICFGGRAIENDTENAHENLTVLKFDAAPGQSATWLYNETEHGYPPMPHPRWSAASVLIKGLIRTGESEPCDRIFIIGGRDKDGLVAEVDVFNLTLNQWEPDWAGLDSGELEDIPPTLGGSGGGIVIGGGDGVQSVKAGAGISVSGDRKNPVVSTDVQAIISQVITEILSSETFKQEIIQALSQDSTLIQNIANSVINNSQFITNVVNEIVSNETILNQIIDSVVNNEYLIENIVQNIVNNQTLLTNIVNEIVSNETLIGEIVNQVINNETLYNEIIEQTLVNQTFINSIANYIVNDSTIVNHITNAILQDNTLVQNIVNQITLDVAGTINVQAVDGCLIGENINGTIYLPIMLMDNEPVNPEPGTLYLIKETNAN